MKEVTYGWYPSAKDIYRPKGRPSSYHVECLYKHGESLYYQGQVAPPEPELFVRGVSPRRPVTPADIRKRGKSVPVPKFSPVPKLHYPTPSQCWSTQKPEILIPETSWGLLDDSAQRLLQDQQVHWPLPTSRKHQQQQQKQQQYQHQQARQLLQQNYEQRQQQQQQQQQQLMKQHLQQKFGKVSPAPQYAWGLQTSSRDPPTPVSVTSSTSELVWPSAHKIVPKRPQTAASGQLSDRQTAREKQHVAGQRSRPSSSPMKSKPAGQSARSCGVVPTPPNTSKSVLSKRPSRIQSATVRREKTPLPSRPVTAGVNRQQAQEDLQQSLPASRPPSRPAAPVPFVYDVNEATFNDEEVDFLQHPSHLEEEEEEEDYEKLVDKFGWRAEVHGDPYQLKKPTKRVSYAVECEEPDVPPEPPQVHMETNEPFFYNTIPARPMTFAVDKEWMSEVLLAKRLELQKREGGIKYSYKNFAFVY